MQYDLDRLWFQKIAASLRLVDNRAQYLAILAQRDLAPDRINDARPDAGGRTFDAAFEAGVGDDPYMADIVARALLLPTSDRPRGGLPLLPAEAALDRALWHIDLALTDSKPPNAGYNTILAGLHELKAQVLLSAHRARWSSEAVTQYLSARAEAHRLRVRLGMARARNRLVAAEQAAGFPFASERIGPILALQSRPRGVPKDRGASMRPGP